MDGGCAAAAADSVAFLIDEAGCDAKSGKNDDDDDYNTNGIRPRGQNKLD